MQLTLPELLHAAPMAPQPAGQIYCNRNLRLDSIDLIGFDMDYTLAIYRQPELDRLSIEATVIKLVGRGYPEFLLKMPYRADFAIRGLLVDRKQGHVLKMDRYRYVKKAYHGFRELSLEERRDLYHSKRIRVNSPRYHWVDTLYALSEVSIYAAVIDALEQQKERVDYEQLFDDVRSCIDEAHRDGSIVDVVANDLPRYIQRDEKLADVLHKLRSSGKKLMLLTNSHSRYTDKMMQYLLADARAEYANWRSYFDIVITAARKPGFFSREEGFVEIGGSQQPKAVDHFERGKVYAGGSLHALRKLVAQQGDRVLYIGDHIYGDVLRAKRSTAWRTAMVMQEMNEEFASIQRCETELRRLDELDRLLEGLQDELRDRLDYIKDLQRYSKNGGSDSTVEQPLQQHKKRAEYLRAQMRQLSVEHSELESAVGREFHPFWGSLFKCGPETSILGEQIEKYACLYTDRVSNFLAYSPNHYFRSPRHQMPHE